MRPRLTHAGVCEQRSLPRTYLQFTHRLRSSYHGVRIYISRAQKKLIQEDFESSTKVIPSRSDKRHGQRSRFLILQLLKKTIRVLRLGHVCRTIFQQDTHSANTDR